MKDYYSILGLTYPSTKSEIKKTYRSLSKIFHPDLNGGANFYESCFKEIKEAYDALVNAPNVVNEELVESATSKIKYFYSDVRSIKNGETVKLTWSTQYCQKLNINVFGPVPPKGTLEIRLDNPTEEFTIELTAIGIDGEILRQDIHLNVIGASGDFSLNGVPSYENQVDMSSVSAKSKTRHKLLPLASAALMMFFAIGGLYSFSSFGNNESELISSTTPQHIISASESVAETRNQIPQERYNLPATLVSKKEKLTSTTPKEEVITPKKEVIVPKEKRVAAMPKNINKKPEKITVSSTPAVPKKRVKVSKFAYGSSLKQVLAVQGVPSSMKSANGLIILQYGDSKVLVESGKVTSIKNAGNLKLADHNTNQKKFGIGSTKQNVIQQQGQPSDVTNLGDSEILHYGNSIVSITNNKVQAFSNTGNNLRVN